MIYYTIRGYNAGFPIDWVNGAGEMHRFEGAFQDPGQAEAEFKVQHPGARYLSPGKWDKLVEGYAEDRYKLSRWSNWVNGG